MVPVALQTLYSVEELMADRSPARRRIVFAHGPWQLLIATAAIRQETPPGAADRAEDLLVIFPLSVGPSTPGPKDVIERLAGATWQWRQVLMTAELVRDSSPEAAARAVESLRALVGDAQADEIWLDCLWGSYEKVAAEAFPGARIVLYEDGLHTYVDAEDNHMSIGRCARRPRVAYRLARSRLHQWRNPGKLTASLMLRRHLRRVRASYLWIDQIVPAPGYQRRLPRVRLQTEAVRRTIREASRVAPDAAALGGIDPDGEPRAIVLGQCFSNHGDLAREQELDCYLATVTALRGAGFSVLWKEHPRTIEPFLPELAGAVDGITATPELGPWPVELFTEQLRLACCAAVTSTSLFSFPLLFGLPSYTMMTPALWSGFRPPNTQMAKLVVTVVPPVQRAAVPSVHD